MTEGVTNTIGVCQVTQVVSPNSFRLKKLKACSRLWRAEGWIGGGDGSDPEIEPRSARRRGADNRHSPPHGGSLPSKLSLPEGRRAGKEAGTTDSEGGQRRSSRSQLAHGPRPARLKGAHDQRSPIRSTRRLPAHSTVPDVETLGLINRKICLSKS